MSDTTKIEKVRVNGVLYDLGGSGGGGSNLGLMYPCTILSSLNDKINEISDSDPNQGQDNKKLIISPADLKNILNSQVDLSELYVSEALDFYLCFAYAMIGSGGDTGFAANNFSLRFTGSGVGGTLIVNINNDAEYQISLSGEISTWEDVFDNLSEDIKLNYWRLSSDSYELKYFCGSDAYYGSLYPGLCNLFLQYDNSGLIITVPLDVNDFINATEVVLEEEATQSEL